MQIEGFHPAPGMGILIPGFWTLPQNPLGDAQPRQVSVTPSMGDILPSHNLLPYNPLQLGPDGTLLKRGVSGCGGCGCAGMGDLSTSIQDALSSLNASIENATGGMFSGTTGWQQWLPYIGGGLLLYLMFSRPRSQDYSKEISKTRSRYPRRITKVGRATRSAYRELTR